jgi:hypothetical protein
MQKYVLNVKPHYELSNVYIMTSKLDMVFQPKALFRIISILNKLTSQPIASVTYVVERCISYKDIMHTYNTGYIVN